MPCAPNYSYEVAAGKAEGQVSGAGCEDQPVVFEHPRFTVIAKAQDGLHYVTAVLPLPEAAPHVDARLDVDSRILGAGDTGVGSDGTLQHEALVPDCGSHTLAEEVRDVEPHHRGVDGVLVDESNSGPCLRGCKGRSNARGPRPNHDHVEIRHITSC